MKKSNVKKYLWQKDVGVGEFFFGEPLPGLKEDYIRIESIEEDSEEHVYSDLSDSLRLEVESGILTGICCEKFFYINKSNIIGNLLTDLELELGEGYNSFNGPWIIGEEEQLAYQFDKLNLQVWVANDYVKAVYCYAPCED